MFEIEKIFRFEAGHSLKHHDGHCRDPHGHSYILSVTIQSNSLIKEGPKTNMVMDFDGITKIVKPMIEQYFDHKWLNDSLQTDASTVEFLTKWIFDYLKPHIPGLTAVTLWETATARATYREFN